MSDHAVPEIIRSENLKTCRGERVRLAPKLQGNDGEATWHDAVAAPDALIALDLFCGAGGLSYGMQCAGFVIAAGIDSDHDACETHAHNCLSKTLCCDIQTIVDPCALMEKLDIPRVDVIIGGPPCQGFSIAGRAKLRSLSVEEREEIYKRNYLYREFVRFVAAIKPLFFVMENVPHLSSFADGIIAREIQEDFGRLGYCVYPELLDAADYGVPLIGLAPHQQAPGGALPGVSVGGEAPVFQALAHDLGADQLAQGGEAQHELAGRPGPGLHRPRQPRQPPAGPPRARLAATGTTGSMRIHPHRFPGCMVCCPPPRDQRSRRLDHCRLRHRRLDHRRRRALLPRP